MSHTKQVVAIVGSTGTVSKSRVLARALVHALARRAAVQVRYVELAELGRQFGAAFTRDELPPPASDALQAIENADLLLVATPVYKGSYPGLFKHVIDLLEPDALVGRPVLLAATGGGDRHALVVEHQLRPLFAFFRAQTVPSAVYASSAEIGADGIESEALQSRIDEASAQAAWLLGAPRDSEAAERLHIL